MWLLSTDRAELRFFNGPLDVSEGFAILSHRWDDHEQTFEDVQALRLQCKADGTNPRELVCTKIRESCKLAEKHGHKWLWIDTCCIDKRSSVELSEAVNSMFRYYSLSNICYAYLRDVPARSDEGWELKFKQSVWHDRAWTLQELIAPKLLLFVSFKWTSLGTKAEHAELINSITTVPAEVLCLEQDISEISIYDRMVWAAARRATKVEDEAYSLMGIFGINMPILYGEGQHAFYRLQEEIMKTSTDTSLFAWGGWNNFRTPTASRSPSPQAESAEPDYCSIHEDSAHYLLAPSPIVFNARRPGIRFHVGSGTGNMSIDPPREDDHSEERVGAPVFTVTPYGVRARIPVIETETDIVAILFCTHEAKPLGLNLVPCRRPNVDPSRPLYHCGELRVSYGGNRVRDFLSADETRFRPRWRTVYISGSPPFHAHSFQDATPSQKGVLQVEHALAGLNARTDAPFRIDVRALARPEDLLSCQAATPTRCGSPAPCALFFNGHQYNRAAPVAYEDEATKGQIFAQLVKIITRPCTNFVLALGVCAVPGSAGEHWARVRVLDEENAVNYDDAVAVCQAEAQVAHACPGDHVASWLQPELPVFAMPAGRYDATRDVTTKLLITVRISFSVCPINESGKTLVPHVDGEVVEVLDEGSETEDHCVHA